MFLLKTPSPLNATGALKEVSDLFKGNIPLPLLNLSVSDGILGVRMASISYYMQHPRISAPLGAAIRLRSAAVFGAASCVSLNIGMLQSMGMGEESLKAVQSCETASVDDLEDNERLLLDFVGKTLTAPEKVTAEDVEALRAAGWQDSDILDAVLQGEAMHAVALLDKAFTR